MTRALIVDNARSMIGTPWAHQGRVAGVGVDCIGSVVLAHSMAGYALIDCKDYGRNPNPRRFLGHLARQMRRVSGGDAADLMSDVEPWRLLVPGDVVVFQFQGPSLPQHLGLASDRGVIHTHQAVGSVVEHALTSDWQRRIHSVWRHKELKA